MPRPGKHKRAQARILRCAQDIGWRIVTRAEAEQRRGFDSSAADRQEKARRPR
jgi:type I restriction enzyme, R subunit